MIEKFVILLLPLFAPSMSEFETEPEFEFESVSVQSSTALESTSTLPLRDPEWARTVRVFSYLQAAVLNDHLADAVFRNDIVFHCKAATATNTDNSIFPIHPGDIDGFKRLDIGYRLGLFLHGWESRSQDNIWMLDILKTWSKRENINVCIVDWGGLSKADYMKVASNIFDVGLTVASVIESLERTKLFDRSNITLTGYSLGAHAAGFAGQRLGGQVDHIIGLDPAGPMFTVPADVGSKYRLDESDGRFVQVIHTTGGVLGVMAKSGHADFYPNGGVSPQTNCAFPFRESTSSRVVCSHYTAVKYFTYSMDKDLSYVGYQCNNYGMFLFGKCRSNAKGIFGIHTKRLSGRFYFRTNKDAPYVERLKI
ncbi:pancreatic triacylglycerol lipase [Eupeodes corollae]|uniref:pancreatic triacylglycerol lipase n=1 Tax=Eupeodes corollae TaxID=290404 RepID=UPI002492EFB5|nr:pancreatic triacylglycerol lipase [Eupeodes corollae]